MKRIITVSTCIFLFSLLVQAQLSIKEKRQKDLLYNEGVEHILNMNYSGAVSSFSESLEIDMSNASAWLNRGRAYAAIGDIETAIADFNQAIYYDSSLAEAYFYKGYFLFNIEPYTITRDLLQSALNLGYEQPELFYYLGLTNLLEGDDDKALINFNKAIAMKDDYSLAYHDRAGIKKKLGDYNGALYDYKTAVNYLENFPIAYNNMGAVKIILGDYEGAIEDFSTAIAQDGEYFMAYNNRGYANYQLANYNSARTDFEKAIELSPGFLEAELNLASTYVKENNYSLALELLDKVIADHPEEGVLFLNRGLIKELSGDIIGACEDWSKAQTYGEEDASEYLKECN